ncbi:MAG: hypothetical protein J6R83_03980, partial [Clostridia bacterium]|nr:hypothetical protein [Clostridia bacterium]
IAMVLVLLVSIFSGCGAVELSKFYNTDRIEKKFKEDVPYTTYSKLSYEDQIVDSFGNVIVFENSNATHNNWTFYDYAKGAVIYTESQPISYEGGIEFVACGEDGGVFYTWFAWVDGNNDEQYKISIHDLNGALIKEQQSKNEEEMRNLLPVENLDFIKIGNEFYRLNSDGEYQLIAKFADAGVVPELTAKNGENYYSIQGDELLVFDNKLNLKLEYSVPTYADDGNMFVLNDGDVLVQYSYAVLPTEGNYTCILDGQPTVVKSYFLDVESGKFDEIKLNYLALDVVSKNTIYAENDTGISFDLLDKSIKTLAVIAEIDGKQINYDYKLVSLKSNAKVKEPLDNLFIGQKSVELGAGVTYNVPIAVSKDRYVVENVLGQLLLIDDYGRIVGDITGYDYTNNKYIVINETIYDYELKEIASCKDYELVESCYLQNSFVFKKEVDGVQKYFLFTNGEYKLIGDIASATVRTAYKNALIVKNITSGKTSVYTENLDVMFTTDAEITIVTATLKGGLIVSGYNQTTSKYETYLIK